MTDDGRQDMANRPDAARELNGAGRLDELCASVLEEHGCPSVSVAVAEHGEVTLARAYGWADAEARVPATPGTPYALASVTKPFTATAVCLAADEKLLQLDAPVPLRPLTPEAGRAAPTVRQLMQHRGGLAAHYDFHYGDSDHHRIDADRYTQLHRRPGSAFEYANLGYRSLGQLLESAAGQSLDRFLQERVCGPLGLPGFHLGPSFPSGPAGASGSCATARPAAVRYTVDGRAYPPQCDSSHPGASLGWATASEVALFAQSCGSLLKPATAAAAVDALPVNSRLGYGLGWCVSSGDGPEIRSHGGSMGGVAVMTAFVPEQDLSVAVLTNSTGKGARDEVVQHMLRTLVPGFDPAQITPALPASSRTSGLPHGSWAGSIRTPDADLPAALRVLPDGRAELEVADERATGRTSASDSFDLLGVFPVQLPTADALLNSPLLALELRGGDGHLSGTARAFKDGDSKGLLGNLLSHRCELSPV
ncbi:serine hydrolase domain-containing protein [Streptomyces ovatisporus]|uniref:Serine hydrolase domain-containing protein n=1 Tax=Streptomyces ovatisporus TaxID=1128682 RepID=A0ABV9A481_9ACTN